MDFTWLTDIFSTLFGWLKSALEWVGNLTKANLTALWNMFLDACCYLADQAAGIAAGLIPSAPPTVLATWASYWDMVPPAVVEVAVAVGIVPAMGIITVAIGIRLALQLIPFVRLGS